MDRKICILKSSGKQFQYEVKQVKAGALVSATFNGKTLGRRVTMKQMRRDPLALAACANELMERLVGLRA